MVPQLATAADDPDAEAACLPSFRRELPAAVPGGQMGNMRVPGELTLLSRPYHQCSRGSMGSTGKSGAWGHLSSQISDAGPLRQLQVDSAVCTDATDSVVAVTHQLPSRPEAPALAPEFWVAAPFHTAGPHYPREQKWGLPAHTHATHAHHPCVTFLGAKC